MKLNEEMKKRNPKVLLGIFLAILICFSGMSGCSNEQTAGEDNKKIEELSAQVEELKATNKDLEKDCSDYKKEIEQLNATLSDTKKEVTKLSKFKNQQKTIDKQKKKIASLKKKNGSLKNTVKSKNVKIASLQKKVNEYKVSSRKAKSSSETTNNSYTVYITRTGSKYHRNGCRYLSRSQIAIDKKDAIAQGYDACSVCNP